MLLLQPGPTPPHGVSSGLVKTRSGLPFLVTGQGCAAVDSLFTVSVNSKILTPKFAHILANDCSEHTRCLTLDTLWPLLSVSYLWCLTLGISQKMCGPKL